MNNKLHGKDLITIGIYTALYIVAIFVASVANVTPLTKGTEIWCGYHLGRDCWLALFGAWHGVNTSVFCCCLYHCTVHTFKKWV